MRINENGIGIEISFWFFAMLCLTAWVHGDTARFALAAAVHETGHIAAVCYFGGRILSVSFKLSGARMKPSFKRPITENEEMICIAAGPAAGLFLCAAAVFWGEKRLAAISAGLSVFNLLPLRGLDGYALCLLLKSRLSGIAHHKLGKNNKAEGRFAQKARASIDHFHKKKKRRKKFFKTR